MFAFYRLETLFMRRTCTFAERLCSKNNTILQKFDGQKEVKGEQRSKATCMRIFRIRSR